MRRFIFGFALLAALTAGAEAQTNDANPSFWTVRTPAGTAYIFSTVHVLPPHTNWHRPEIDGAIAASDTFVFEVPTGRSELAEETRFIIDHGRLPRGTTLRSLLSPDANQQYEQACDLAGISPRALDDKRPWLASIILADKYLAQRHYLSANAPDEELTAIARRADRDIRYLDTTQEQLDLLADPDGTSGLEGLTETLAGFQQQPTRVNALLDAWGQGDPKNLQQEVSASLRKRGDILARIARHNLLWADRVERLLAEKHTYFISVGAAHLIGPGGLPSLLRAAGYKVDGP